MSAPIDRYLSFSERLVSIPTSGKWICDLRRLIPSALGLPLEAVLHTTFRNSLGAQLRDESLLGDLATEPSSAIVVEYAPPAMTGAAGAGTAAGAGAGGAG